MVKALTPLGDFNEYFSAEISCDEVDTVGGFVTKHFGHLPKRDESVDIDSFSFTVLNSDSRRVHLLRLTLAGQRPLQAS